MREMRIVIRREFLERVRTRAFILSTILMPVVVIGVLLVPALLERSAGGATYRLVLVDEAPEGLGELVVARLSSQTGSEREDTIRVEHVRQPLEAVRDSLSALARDGDLDGFLSIGEDFLETGHAVYRAPVVTNMNLNQRIRSAISETVQGERMERAGLDGGEVATILAPGRLETSQLRRAGDEGRSTGATMGLAYVVTFALYMFLILYGSQVLQSVHEEKSNRIAEVLMSSIRAPHLLAGKVFGVGAAAAVQVVVWGALGGLAIVQRGRIAEAFGMPAEMFGPIQLDLFTLVPLALFGVLGFFLYAAMFAAVGAATEDMQDAQQFMWAVLLPLIVPLVLQFRIVSEPGGALATTLSWIPFTAPLAVPIRMGATHVAPVEIAGSLLSLALGVAAVSWAAGKIYRIGILSTGKRATVSDLWRWVRSA